jgi:hypothetical protein
MAAGFYDDAITEYRRYLFFSEDPVAYATPYRNIGYCYAHLDALEHSIDAMDRAVLYTASDSARGHRRVDRAVVLMAFGQYERAARDLEGDFRHSRFREVSIRAGTLLLLSSVLAHDWERALDIHRELDLEESHERGMLEESLQGAAAAEYKSPDTAVLLSTLLPGAGQAYCGHWRAGLNALVLNGVFIYATVTSLINEQYASAALQWIFLLRRYYNGNRYQAHRIATMENEHLDERLAADILGRLQTMLEASALHSNIRPE